MAENTESIILSVARKNFVQNGFAGARMQAIADEAGINKAMLHYYFRSKDKLYQEIINQTLNNFMPRISQALTIEGTFWDKVENLVETYIKILLNEPDIPFFIMSELSQKRERFIEELKKRSQFFPAAQLFIQSMIKEMEAGKIRAVNPMHLFLNLIGMTVFPFIAKPIFCTIADIPDVAYNAMMKERKDIILDFLKHALRVD